MSAGGTTLKLYLVCHAVVMRCTVRLHRKAPVLRPASFETPAISREILSNECYLSAQRNCSAPAHACASCPINSPSQHPVQSSLYRCRVAHRYVALPQVVCTLDDHHSARFACARRPDMHCCKIVLSSAIYIFATCIDTGSSASKRLESPVVHQPHMLRRHAYALVAPDIR